MANLKCHMHIMVNVAVYAMRCATGPELPPGVVLLRRGRGTLEGIREKMAWVIWLFTS